MADYIDAKGVKTLLKNKNREISNKKNLLARIADSNDKITEFCLDMEIDARKSAIITELKGDSIYGRDINTHLTVMKKKKLKLHIIIHRHHVVRSPPLLIVHCFRQVLRATSRIGTELLYVGSSWSSCLCSSM